MTSSVELFSQYDEQDITDGDESPLNNRSDNSFKERVKNKVVFINFCQAGHYTKKLKFGVVEKVCVSATDLSTIYETSRRRSEKYSEGSNDSSFPDRKQSSFIDGT